jgi:hypothetical protein
MDIEDQMKHLQTLLTYALSGAVSAKARYLALSGEPGATPAAVARAKMMWRQLESRKTAIVAKMVALEEMKEDSVAYWMPDGRFQETSRNSPDTRGG